MESQNFFSRLNIFNQCQQYHLPLWQCPSFLFVVMGLVIIITSIATYLIGARYIQDPEMVAFIVLLLTGLLLIVSFAITNSFERLAEANRMKAEFISVVSHQLRSPLTNLKWSVEFLMSGRTEDIEQKATEYFKILNENVDRMSGLVSDLLTVSRIETTSLPLHKKEFSLEELINSLLLNFGPFAKASNLELKFQADEKLPMVFADPHQIEQVAENLIDNAVRYSKAKGIVEINLKRQKNNLRFEIKDSGVGIPKEDQKYIFQKFFRAENVAKHQTQGSGLGLYIAKAIIEKSGGQIGFQSQEGIGSIFWFTLPIVKNK